MSEVDGGGSPVVQPPGVHEPEPEPSDGDGDWVFTTVVDGGEGGPMDEFAEPEPLAELFAEPEPELQYDRQPDAEQPEQPEQVGALPEQVGALPEQEPEWLWQEPLSEAAEPAAEPTEPAEPSEPEPAQQQWYEPEAPAPAAPLPPEPELEPVGGATAAEVGHDVDRLTALERRLTALEALPGGLETLGRVTRQELERCAGVLFGHDRALKEARDRSDALAARLDATAAGEPLGRIEQRLAAMEAHVQPLEAVPTIVQALRRAVRSSDDVLAGEVTAREAQVAALAGELAAEAQARDEALRRQLAQDLDRMASIAATQVQTLADAAARMDAVEARLAPLDSAPSDIEAIGRVLRRELDAIVADNQARDQLLRRALQQEIDQLRAESAARAQLATELVARIEAAEALRETVRAELDEMQAGSKAHDQVMGEITRTFSALDSRLARLDPVPGELQSLRTALRQEGERSITQLRVVEERLSQLSWVPGEFQEARKRILTLTSGLQLEQDSLKSLEAALAATNERVRALGAELDDVAPPRPSL